MTPSQKALYSALLHPVGNEVSPLWELLLAFVAKAASAE